MHHSRPLTLTFKGKNMVLDGWWELPKMQVRDPVRGVHKYSQL